MPRERDVPYDCPGPSRIRCSRRAAVAALAAAGAGAAVRLDAAVPRRGIPLGFDNFAVRGLGWNVRQLVDHAVELRCDSVFVTDFGPFDGRLDDASLGAVRDYARDRGVALALGSWSICPTSTSFRREMGTPDEQLAEGVRMARALGTTAYRVILGSRADRGTPGGIDARIADTVRVLRAARGRCLDAGVRIAVENHAGDMQSRELERLVQEAGPDFVGVNFDSGNACWTLEDPLVALERLAPHVLTTSLRDTMVWETPDGVTAQWTAMGEGCTDLPAFFDLFARRCPQVVAHIETISGAQTRFAIRDPSLWREFPEQRAGELAAFLALARKGRPLEPFRPPAGPDRAAADRDHQLAELAKSIRHCREQLGLGRRD
jgi:sugar phosphate isomerase/epimerase